MRLQWKSQVKNLFVKQDSTVLYITVSSMILQLIFNCEYVWGYASRVKILYIIFSFSGCILIFFALEMITCVYLFSHWSCPKRFSRLQSFFSTLFHQTNAKAENGHLFSPSPTSLWALLTRYLDTISSLLLLPVALWVIHRWKLPFFYILKCFICTLNKSC